MIEMLHGEGYIPFDHISGLTFHGDKKTDGVEIFLYLINLIIIEAFPENIFPKISIKGFQSGFNDCPDTEKIPHGLNFFSVNPVGFEKEGVNSLFIYDLFYPVECSAGKLKYIPGVYNFKDTISSGYLAQNSFVQ